VAVGLGDRPHPVAAAEDVLESDRVVGERLSRHRDHPDRSTAGRGSEPPGGDLDLHRPPQGAAVDRLDHHLGVLAVGVRGRSGEHGRVVGAQCRIAHADVQRRDHVLEAGRLRLVDRGAAGSGSAGGGGDHLRRDQVAEALRCEATGRILVASSAT
jgi:hypothetical protein